MDPAQFKARIDQIHADLDQYSYYELLNLSTDAAPDAIRAAFHRMALSMHPDRYQTHPDAELRSKLYEIYKRVTEGYKILSDSRTRKEYDQGLAEGQLRLVRTERKKSGVLREEEAIESPQARKFFLLAQTAERRGDFKGARLNYKLALNMAADHPVIQAHLRRLDEEGK